MFPGAYDLRLYRGDSYAWRFQLWTDAAHTIAFDLTGVAVAAEMRDKSGGATVIDMTCAVTLPNLIDMTLPAASWPQVPAGAVWDLQLTRPDTRVQTIIAGKVTVTADVTDSTAAVYRRVRAV